MIRTALKSVAAFGFLAFATVASAGTISSGGSFTDNASSGIGTFGRTGPGVNFDDSTLVINGVTFQGSANRSGTLGTVGYALGNVPNDFPGPNGTSTGVSGTVAGLDNRFFYDGNLTESLTLTNLIVGETYVLTQYNFAFGDPGSRVGNISDSQGGSLLAYDENGTPGNILQDRFVADSTTFTISYGPYGPDSFHQYDFQLTALPEPGSIAALAGLGAMGLIGLVVRRRRSS